MVLTAILNRCSLTPASCASMPSLKYTMPSLQLDTYVDPRTVRWPCWPWAVQCPPSASRSSVLSLQLDAVVLSDSSQCSDLHFWPKCGSENWDNLNLSAPLFFPEGSNHRLGGPFLRKRQAQSNQFAGRKDTWGKEQSIRARNWKYHLFCFRSEVVMIAWQASKLASLSGTYKTPVF